MMKIFKIFIAIFLIFNVSFCDERLMLDTNDSILSSNALENNHSSELSIMSLYENAHIVVKVVIYILVFFSIITWCVFIVKFIAFSCAFRRIKKDERFFKKLQSLDDEIILYKKSYLLLMINEVKDEILKSKVVDKDLKNRIKFRLEIQINKFTSIIKYGISLLASIGAVSPFIGLFGTVWGIMNSFTSIAASDNVSLSVVAPGIAEALFATALGLIAAIPAVLFYNYFTKLSSRFSEKILHLVSDLYIISDREISKKDSHVDI